MAHHAHVNLDERRPVSLKRREIRVKKRRTLWVRLAYHRTNSKNSCISCQHRTLMHVTTVQEAVWAEAMAQLCAENPEKHDQNRCLVLHFVLSQKFLEQVVSGCGTLFSSLSTVQEQCVRSVARFRPHGPCVNRENSFLLRPRSLFFCQTYLSGL